MPPPYRQPHYGVFVGIPYVPQGAVGFVPAAWVAQHALLDVPNAAGLPGHQLNRVEVRKICRNPANHVLFGYVCAMAWGIQGTGRGGRGHVAAAWAARDRLTRILTMLRAGELTRREAYNLFTGVNRIPGLGPSYFTKLLYFFSPTPNFYIMDQHTGKSVDLLTGEWVVRISGNAVSRENEAGNYQAFCEEADHLSILLRQTGEQIEEKMFSSAGNGGPRGAWRTYVAGNWPAAAPHHRYSARRMHALYPHIPLLDF